MIAVPVPNTSKPAPGLPGFPIQTTPSTQCRFLHHPLPTSCSFILLQIVSWLIKLFSIYIFYYKLPFPFIILYNSGNLSTGTTLSISPNLLIYPITSCEQGSENSLQPSPSSQSMAFPPLSPLVVSPSSGILSSAPLSPQVPSMLSDVSLGIKNVKLKLITRHLNS